MLAATRSSVSDETFLEATTALEDELESREQQCTADFERVRELSDRVQVGAVFPHGGFAAFGALSSSTFPPVPPSLPLSVPLARSFSGS